MKLWVWLIAAAVAALLLILWACIKINDEKHPVRAYRRRRTIARFLLMALGFFFFFVAAVLTVGALTSIDSAAIPSGWMQGVH